nr:unnamed protein product [Homo sapiens]
MCPLFSCQWEGRLEVVVPHLRQIHRVDILQGAEIVFLATDMHLPAPADWIIMHSCLGHHFLLVLRKQERHEGHPQFFATMMLIGTPTQADCFTYRLEDIVLVQLGDTRVTGMENGDGGGARSVGPKSRAGRGMEWGDAGGRCLGLGNGVVSGTPVGTVLEGSPEWAAARSEHLAAGDGQGRRIA